MTIEMQVLTLFGGLAKVRIRKPIELGSSKTLENATLSIGTQYIEISPKTINNETSYFWGRTKRGDVYPLYRFGDRRVIDPLIKTTCLIKNLVFLSVYTWANGQRGVKQKQIVAYIVKKSTSPIQSGVIASISAQLNSEKINSLYNKNGTKEKAEYSLSKDFEVSPQMKFIRFIPSENALRIVKKRAESYKERQKIE